MMRVKYQVCACALAVAGVLARGGYTARADQNPDGPTKARHGRAIFVVAMENHNWTQPSSVTSPQQIFMNPEAPFLNSLVNGTSGISGQVAYATNYLNAGVGIHPSEPNYIWAEAGTNFGVNNDDNPYHNDCSPDTVQTTDLQKDEVADYNWITPNQFNDQHTTLTNGYGGPAGSPLKTDAARIAQGDNFVARIVPLLMASQAYKDHGIIVLWWDESEGGDTSAFRLPFMVISSDVHENVDGTPFASSVEYSHSSFLRTMQEFFNVDPDHGFPWLGGAATASDLSALFKPGAVK
jgi:phosphatidylinositol-3-phosphatase